MTANSEYNPAYDRYNTKMSYNNCGKSGLLLPQISLGLWHNFGDVDNQKEAIRMLTYAFDNGITHFDLANNYGTPHGSAESNFGKIVKSHFDGYRHEMIISTKAGHAMWPGPYGDGGSRKYMIASLEQSLKRLKLDYVDIYYSHRYDPSTPLEETMSALSDMVRQGKALYAGISKYPPEIAKEAYRILRHNGTPCLIYQDKYNILSPEIESQTLPLAQQEGVGTITFSPLAQGLLTDKYLHGIPSQSRAGLEYGFLQKDEITHTILVKIAALNEMAIQRGQTLAQMALSWCIANPLINSVIVGASSVKQLQDNLKASRQPDFTPEELNYIKQIVCGSL